MSGLQKRYYAKLYRIGKLKKKPYSQVWKYRDDIRKMHKPVSYTHLDVYKRQYQNCGDLEETLMAACDLMAMEFAKTPQVVDVDSLYKDADEKVVFQLINTEQNKSFLEQVPHREFQDLSIIYKLVVNADTESIQSIKVTNLSLIHI